MTLRLAVCGLLPGEPGGRGDTSGTAVLRPQAMSVVIL